MKNNCAKYILTVPYQRRISLAQLFKILIFATLVWQSGIIYAGTKSSLAQDKHSRTNSSVNNISDADIRQIKEALESIDVRHIVSIGRVTNECHCIEDPSCSATVSVNIGIKLVKIADEWEISNEYFAHQEKQKLIKIRQDATAAGDKSSALEATKAEFKIREELQCSTDDFYQKQLGQK